MKFFDTALPLEFERFEEDNAAFLQDFHQGGNAALSKWKKLAAKVDFSEGEELLFHLLLSLKEDIMRIEDELAQKSSALKLANKGIISALAFEGFKFKEQCLQKDAFYYARANIAHHRVSFFFKALSSDEASITQMKKEDKTLFDAFVVDIQRQLIHKRKDTQ